MTSVREPWFASLRERIEEVVLAYHGQDTYRVDPRSLSVIPGSARRVLTPGGRRLVDEIEAAISQETLMREAVAAATDSGRSFDAPGGEQQGEANSQPSEGE